MASKHNLPIEIHEHFRKANILHGYVSEHLGEARNHALETGQELLAAKKAIPHGRWEDECKRLFDGSDRTARFYMEFAKHMGAIPKTAARAVLMLEGTLEGAAKAAKKAAKPKPPKPPEPDDEPIDVDSQPATPAEVQEAVAQAAADDAAEEYDNADADSEKPSKAATQPPRKLDKAAYYKQWEQAIGPVVRLVDKIGNGVGEKGGGNHSMVMRQLDSATEAMARWMQIEI
jgi:hypothetical protein